MYTPAIGTRIIGVTRKRPGERAACQRCAAQIARRTAARRGRAAALLLCGRCRCCCRSSFLAGLLCDLVTYGVHLAGDALVLGLLLLLVRLQALLQCLLLLLAGFQLLSLILQVFLILYLLVLGSLQIIALLLNILLGSGVLRYDLLIIIHDRGNNLQTAEKIREVGRVQQNLQIAGLALLIRRADSLRKTLLLAVQRLDRSIQLGRLDVDLVLQAVDIRGYRRNFFFGELDLFLQGGTGLCNLIHLACQTIQLRLDRCLLILQIGQLAFQFLTAHRTGINQTGGDHREHHRCNQDARNNAGDQAHGFLFHHIETFAPLCSRYTSINLRILVTEPPMPNNAPAPQYTPSTHQRSTSNESR